VRLKEMIREIRRQPEVVQKDNMIPIKAKKNDLCID
jgi:hypothetical protein